MKSFILKYSDSGDTHVMSNDDLALKIPSQLMHCEPQNSPVLTLAGALKETGERDSAGFPTCYSGPASEREESKAQHVLTNSCVGIQQLQPCFKRGGGAARLRPNQDPGQADTPSLSASTLCYPISSLTDCCCPTGVFWGCIPHADSHTVLQHQLNKWNVTRSCPPVDSIITIREAVIVGCEQQGRRGMVCRDRVSVSLVVQTKTVNATVKVDEIISEC